MEFTIGHILFFVLGFWAGLVTAGVLAATRNSSFAAAIVTIAMIGSQAFVVLVLRDGAIALGVVAFAAFALYMLLIEREPKAALIISIVSLVPVGFLTLTRIAG